MLDFPYITTFYSGLLGLLYLLLSSYVVMGRWQYRVTLEHGDNQDMLKRIRMHANFAEYVPFLLFLMLLLEIREVPDWAMHLFGFTLLVARLLHPVGMTIPVTPNIFRVLGILLTYTLLGLGSLAAMGLYFWR